MNFPKNKTTKNVSHRGNESTDEELPEIGALAVSDLSPMEEDQLLAEDDVRPSTSGVCQHRQSPEPNDANKHTFGKREKLSRSAIRRKRIQEALAKGEKILTRQERRLEWEAKQKAAYEARQALPSTPSVSDPSGQNCKRPRSQITPDEAGAKTKRVKPEGAAEEAKTLSFAEATSAEKLAIVADHPETKLPENLALNLRREIGKRALSGDGVRFGSTRYEAGALVFSCLNLRTKTWLENQFQKLNPYMEVQLKLGPAKSLVRTAKVSCFVPESSGADTREEILKGLKRQNGLNTDHWSICGGKAAQGGRSLVITVDEESWKKLKEMGLRAAIGCESVAFKLQGPDPTLPEKPQDGGPANQPPPQ